VIRRPPPPPLFPSRRSSDLAEGVGAGRQLHGETGGGRAAPAQVEAERRGALLDPGHVAQANRAAVAVGAQNDRAELFGAAEPPRSEEHTSELQSRENLVCRL